MSDLKYIPACGCCTHEFREEIDSKILSGKYTQKQIAVDYGISEQSVSNHKNKHVLDSSENVERLQLLVQKALQKDLEPDNIHELVKLLEYNDRLETRKCETCSFRNKINKTLEEAIKEFIGFEDDNPEWEDIYITPEENNLFIAWLKTLAQDNELRKKYKYYEMKIK